MTEEVRVSDWYAAVRYGDKQKECVKVKNIKKFHPASGSDFNPTTVYKIKTNSWSADKKYQYYSGVIEGLGVNKAGAQLSRKAFLANQTETEKDKIAFVLSQIPHDPQQTTDLSASDAGEVLGSTEKQADDRRKALRDANNALTSQILTNMNGKLPSVSRQTINSAKNKEPAKASTKRKVTEKLAETLFDSQQKKKHKAQTKHKENAAKNWGDRLFLESSGPLHTVSVSTDTLKSSPKAAAANLPAHQSTKSDICSTRDSSGPLKQSALNPISINNSPDVNKVQNCSFSECQCCGTVTKEYVESLIKKMLEKGLSKCINCEGLKTEIQILQGEIKGLKSEFSVKLQSIETNIVTLIQDRMNAADCGSSLPAGSGVTTLFGKVVTGGKVNLGSGFVCSEIGWKAMNTRDKITDWCVAILRGTFGDKAMQFRISPRYDDLDYFPPGFIDMAKNYYSLFVARRIEELQDEVKNKPDDLCQTQLQFYLENSSRLVNQLGAQLSDRAEGMYKQWRTRQIKLGVQLPQRKKRASTVKKPLPGIEKEQLKKKKNKLLTLPSLRTCARVESNKPQRKGELHSSAAVNSSAATIELEKGIGLKEKGETTPQPCSQQARRKLEMKSPQPSVSSLTKANKSLPLQKDTCQSLGSDRATASSDEDDSSSSVSVRSSSPDISRLLDSPTSSESSPNMSRNLDLSNGTRSPLMSSGNPDGAGPSLEGFLPPLQQSTLNVTGPFLTSETEETDADPFVKIFSKI